MFGRHMSSELLPVSTALLHGFKAVAAPHPIYSDKDLPAKSTDRWFNPGINGRSGSSQDSPFGWKRESRFLDLSWYYRANLAGRLYWNFLGWQKDWTGGRVVSLFNFFPSLPPSTFFSLSLQLVSPSLLLYCTNEFDLTCLLQYEFIHGRVILPSILFHPIKDVRPDANSMGYDFNFQL